MSMDDQNTLAMATVPITLELMVRHNISLLAPGLVSSVGPGIGPTQASYSFSSFLQGRFTLSRIYGA